MNKIDKFIQSLDHKTKNRLRAKLIEIKRNPFTVSGVKKLKGWGNNTYRARLGKSQDYLSNFR